MILCGYTSVEMADQIMPVDGIEAEVGWCHLKVLSEEHIQSVTDAGNWI
jgi:hypothetical protein